MSFAARAAEKELELNLLIRPEVPQKVKGDPTRLRQIISNLVSNAIKFTVKGDILVELNVKGKSKNEIELVITVTDTGIGMSRETTDKLFSPFTQADASSTRKYGGTGLGLSICKRLVEMMNGTISVESQVGRGSIFQFSILLKTTNEKDTSEFPDYAALRGRRIMIIDDHAINREVGKIYLEEIGIMVDEAKSATEALSKLIRCDGSKCIHEAILIDCHMPGMNGHDLSAALKAISVTKDIPLLLVTSVASNDEAKKAKTNGFAGYLTKPYKRKELLDCVSMVLIQKNTNSNNIDSFVTRHVVREAEFSKRPRILLAEDNEMNRNLFIKLLHLNGLSCDTVENGEEALQACINSQYDIVFMDCQMPVLSGYDATRKIREAEGQNRHSVIIAVTAYALKEDEDRCREAGMDGYISKPVSLEAVMNAISKVHQIN
jgi:two-component system sensor histidine kinase/response regulator